MLLHPIIDYVSISIPTANLLRQWENSLEWGSDFPMDDRTSRLCELIARNTDWTDTPQGGIFKRRVQFPYAGMCYFEGHNHVSLLQISGKGCEILRNEGILDDVIIDWQDRITRLDVAIDIVCDVRPEDFILQRITGRFRDGGHYPSESGVTWYVGSRKSDRFARVYRRNLPDIRHDKLRIEYQLSDVQAKIAVKDIISSDILTYANQLANSFGWIHPVYVHETQFGKAKSVSRPSSQGNTQYWLHKQVLPSLRKSAQMGDIDTLIVFESQLRGIIEEYYTEREAKNGHNSLQNGTKND